MPADFARAREQDPFKPTGKAMPKAMPARPRMGENGQAPIKKGIENTVEHGTYQCLMTPTGLEETPETLGNRGHHCRWWRRRWRHILRHLSIGQPVRNYIILATANISATRDNSSVNTHIQKHPTVYRQHLYSISREMLGSVDAPRDPRIPIRSMA